MKRFSVGLVALAVVLTGATQLRMQGLPLGPGEGLLAVWLLLMAVLFLGGRVVSDSVAGLLLMYWLIAAALLGFGSFMAVITGKLGDRADIALHHAAAFLLVAMFSYFVAFGGTTRTAVIISRLRASRSSP